MDAHVIGEEDSMCQMCDICSNILVVLSLICSITTTSLPDRANLSLF